MKTRVLACLILSALVVAVAQPASAGLLLGSNLTYGLNTLQDNSVSYLADANGGLVAITPTTTIGVGSNIVGVLKIISNNTTGVNITPNQGEMDVVFALTVTATHSSASTPNIAPNWIGFDLQGAPNMLQKLLPSFSGNIANNSVFAVLSATGNNLSGQLDPTILTPTAAFTLLNTTSGTAAHALDMVGGLSGGTSSSFLQGVLWDRNHNGVIDPLNDYLTPGAPITGGGTLAPLTPQDVIGQEKGVLSVSYSAGVGPLVNVGVAPLYNAGGYDINTLILGQVGLQSSLLGPDPTQLGHAWAFADNSVFTLNVIPEPASLIVWSLLVAGAGVLGIRASRRRKA